MKKIKLSATQEKVMLWLSQGWGARNSHGSVIEINGEPICKASTITVLEGYGLVKKEENGFYWKATEKGRRLSPTYQQDDFGPTP